VHSTNISAEFEFGVIAPLGAPKCGVGLRRWENQRSLSSLVITSANEHRFSQFFHCKIPQEILFLYISVTETSTSP